MPEKIPKEGTWARLIYDLRRIEATKTEGMQKGWYDPQSPNYRGARFGLEDVDWSVLTTGGGTGYATPEEQARRQAYIDAYGYGGRTPQTPGKGAGPGGEVFQPPVTTLPGREVRGFWDRNQINPGSVRGFDPGFAYDAWQAQTKLPRPTDEWMKMYGPGAKPVLGGKLSAANARAQATFNKNRKPGQVDANGNPLPEPPGGSGGQPTHDLGEPADLSWIENYGQDWYGRGNPKGLSKENTRRYEESGGTDAGAMNRWGQPLGYDAPLNAFGGGGPGFNRSANKKAKNTLKKGNNAYNRNRALGKIGPIIKDNQRKNRQAAKANGAGGGGGGGNRYQPPTEQRSGGGGYANDLINWTW